MRYSKIDECEMVNGSGCGISIYCQGCHLRCPGCFNSIAWDFNGGKEWASEVEKEFIKLIDRPYIKRISVLGGEPLADENVPDVLKLVNKIRLLFPEKSIWLFTGYTWESIFNPVITDDFNPTRDNLIIKRQCIVSAVDVLVDGRFEEDKKNLSLAFRGSSNQRIIDVEQSLKQKEIVLWTN